MHVNGNNEGPSLAVAVGDWKEGGRLWCYDVQGDSSLPVPNKLEGYPDIEVEGAGGKCIGWARHCAGELQSCNGGFSVLAVAHGIGASAYVEITKTPKFHKRLASQFDANQVE